MRHATYDFTEQSAGGGSGPNLGLVETWVDVKTPGDGRTYSVGTIEIERTRLGGVTPAPFSGATTDRADGLLHIDNLAFGISKKQVVMLQVTGPDASGIGQSIVWQRFYYGFAEDSARWTNARGISVWPAATREDSRIAICGDSTNNGLPLDPIGSLPGTAVSKGFIAVFDGNGQHLWSHAIFLRDAQANWTGNSAVTDVSIRVDGDRDVITYCGITRAGALGFPGDPGNAKLPFAAPAGCSTAAGGSSQVPGSWDGFVGRISRSHSATPPTLIHFHSVVGGDQEDGLFGIDEIDAHRFVVVGTTRQVFAGSLTFPFTSVCVTPSFQPYSLGVAMLFDAAPTAGQPPGNLVLQWSQHLGSFQTSACSSSPNTEPLTRARDVVVQRNYSVATTPPHHLILVAGSTNDCGMFDVFPSLVPSPAYSPPSAPTAPTWDGFVLGIMDHGAGAPAPQFAAFRGSSGNEEIRGIQAWNEHPDHFSIVSSVGLEPDADIEVASYWLPVPVQPIELRTVQMQAGTTAATLQPSLGYMPTRLGQQNAGLADFQGGGIAVDDTGRATVVGGMTDTAALATYASSTTANAPGLVAGRTNNYPQEAFRVVVDLLADRVGRTDGTGVPAPTGGTQFPVAGYFGGTTPECALRAFGSRIGDPTLPVLPRMLIDAWFTDSFTGALTDPAGGVFMTMLVDRPPAASIALSAWQIGFPGASGGSPVPTPLDGVLLWTPNNPATYWVGTGGMSVSQGWQLPPVNNTVTPIAVTVQLVCALGTPIPGNVVGPTCTGTTTWAASPALWFHYSF